MPRLFFIHAGETPNAAYFSSRERRRPGGSKSEEAEWEGNAACFLPKLP